MKINNLFYRLFFFQASPLIKIAKTKILSPEDMLELPEFLDPRKEIISNEKIDYSSKYKFVWTLFKQMKGSAIKCYICLSLAMATSLLSPFFIHRFITQISAGVETPEKLKQALITGILMGSCGFLIGFLFQHYYYNFLTAQQLLINFLNRKIFQQSLRLSKQARQKSQVGDIVNYMSSDTESISQLIGIMGDAFWIVVTIGCVSTMLYYYIGVSALVALAVLMCIAPLSKYVATRFVSLDEEMMGHRDRRVTLMTQTLNAIRVVKFFAWEKSVKQEVAGIRHLEIRSRRKMAQAEVIATLAYLAVSTFVLFIALATHAWRGGVLDAATIFTCISLFGLLEEPFGSLSRLISSYTSCLVSTGRILQFFKLETVDNNLDYKSQKLETVGLQAHQLTAFYDQSSESAIANINFKLAPGSSIAIVGPVGSGKSSLLLALMGEIKKSKGEVVFSGIHSSELPRIAYVPQEAYIINSTLKENIQFGVSSLSNQEMQKALHLSCLDKDLQEWNTGLETEIGEKGVNLSGGQKQRVGLARAYVNNPQVIFLDDPLSAVDFATEDQLCERLIFGEWQNKTRVVVTHRLESLSRFDQVLFLKEGRSLAYGSFDDVMKNPEFAFFYSEHSQQTEKIESNKVQVEVAAKPEVTTSSRITEDEDRETGAVKSSVYFDYIKALGGENKKTQFWIICLLFVGAATVTSLPILQQWWMSYFTAQKIVITPVAAVGIYGLIGLSVLIATFLNKILWLDRGISAGQNLHDRMLNSVLNTSIRFFDSTPVGRVLQRFSRDIESVDIYLQWSFEGAVHCFLQVITAIVLIISFLPLMVFVVIPVMTLYYFVQNSYRRPAREAKRLDSVARSPRYAHFKETLMGLVVIRAYGKSAWFMEEFYQRLQHSNRMFYNHYMLNRWFSSRIPLIGGMISIGTAVTIVYSAKSGLITAGQAGLLSIYAMSFWASLNWAVRVFSDIESRMTSIERLRYFANLPAEPSVTRESAQVIPENWPHAGEIKAQNLQVRYAEHLPLILKGLNFEIKAGSRVGIIGRTGSGKSTLFQTLFRFIELEKGQIIIDGIDIASVPLERLRRSLAIVPQDPTLFMGTIRNNLDRYNEYSDFEIQQALEKASLWEFISGLPLVLLAPVLEGGQNLSQGQRQLLCLARALLTKAKVIVMDEATASVDVQTDAILQKVIRQSLAGVTLLIIAHRLETVADSDQLIEIADGLIVDSKLKLNSVSEKEF